MAIRFKRSSEKPNEDTTQSTCASCGSSMKADWAFCGSCGSRSTRNASVHGSEPEAATQELEAVAALDPGRTTTDADERRSGRMSGIMARVSWRRMLIAAAVVLVGLLVLNDIGTHRRLSQTRTALTETRSTLAQTRKDLASTERQLAEVQARLASTESDLSARTKERDDLRAQLDTKSTELVGVRGSLTAAEGRVNLQAGQIETLKSCLNGVSEALVYAARLDYQSALAALRSVQVSCDRAYALF